MKSNQNLYLFCATIKFTAKYKFQFIKTYAFGNVGNAKLKYSLFTKD